MKITIYTDGSSRGNPGRGGWGCVLITEHKKEEGRKQNEEEMQNTEDEVIELGGREDMTTNNRMELLGAIMGLREIGKEAKEIEVYTDSQYVKKGMTEWIDGWIKRGWKGSTKKPVLNQDLWEALKKEEDRLKAGGVKVTWKYVQAHVGIPLNERVDTIATMCADDANDLQLYRGLKSEYTL